jgi:hypothetical protein
MNYNGQSTEFFLTRVSESDEVGAISPSFQLVIHDIISNAVGSTCRR